MHVCICAQAYIECIMVRSTLIFTPILPQACPLFTSYPFLFRTYYVHLSQVWNIIGSMGDLPGHIPEEKWFSLPQEISNVKACYLELGYEEPFPYLCWNIDWNSSNL